MTNRRDVRRLAMQILYQFDLRGFEDQEQIHEGLSEGPDLADVQEEAFQLAKPAWEMRSQADTLTTELAPDWPSHRQPPVDRAVLRLAYYEIVSGHAPAKVVINEAVELAKTFGSEQSPAFINGVLDKVAKRLAGEIPESADADQPTDSANPEPPNSPVQ